MAEILSWFGRNSERTEPAAITPSDTHSTKGTEMQIADHEQQRSRARAHMLSRHYRQIGPAAIIAALMFQPQRKRSLA
jgi:hypothetical protein